VVTRWRFRKSCLAVVPFLLAVGDEFASSRVSDYRFQWLGGTEASVFSACPNRLHGSAHRRNRSVLLAVGIFLSPRPCPKQQLFLFAWRGFNDCPRLRWMSKCDRAFPVRLRVKYSRPRSVRDSQTSHHQVAFPSTTFTSWNARVTVSSRIFCRSLLVRRRLQFRRPIEIGGAFASFTAPRHDLGRTR